MQKNQILSYNYQYQISSLLYRLLKYSSREYASILHDHGLSWENKDYKLFNFSQLQFDDFKTTRQGIRINGIAKLIISSPLDEFAKHLVNGIFQQNQIRIGTALFEPLELQVLPAPKLSDSILGLCRSPLVVSTMHEVNGGLKPYYYRASDPEICNAVISNLVHKYSAFTKEEFPEDIIRFEFDQSYLERKTDREVSKLITIKEGTPQETHIKGVVAPFQLTGNPEILEFAWNAGLGERTSQGFGFWDPVYNE